MVLVTFTVIVQELPAAIVPPVSETLPEPAMAVAVPPQVLVSPFGVATSKLDGKVSVKATPTSATVFAAGFVIVSVSVEGAVGKITVGLNALAITGGVTTVSEAEAVPPVPPSVEVTWLVVLFLVPAVVPVTSTENLHALLAAIVAPASLMEPEPAVAVIVPPPQLPARLFGVETIKPTGSESVNPIPDRLVVVLLF